MVSIAYPPDIHRSVPYMLIRLTRGVQAFFQVMLGIVWVVLRFSLSSGLFVSATWACWVSFASNTYRIDKEVLKEFFSGLLVLNITVCLRLTSDPERASPLFNISTNSTFNLPPSVGPSLQLTTSFGWTTSFCWTTSFFSTTTLFSQTSLFHTISISHTFLHLPHPSSSLPCGEISNTRYE